MESVLYISTIVDNGGNDMVYTDFKNNLYSPVSHITFTHQPRLESTCKVISNEISITVSHCDVVSLQCSGYEKI